MATGQAPKRILILGKRFKVVAHTKESLPDEAGLTKIMEQELCFRTDDHFEGQRDTLLHEVIHGIELQLGYKLTEAQVSGLAAGLLQVLRDNPGFAKWLLEPAPKDSEGEEDP